MRRYVLTGAPGAGKTTRGHLLAARGHTVIHDAATDEPSGGNPAGARPDQDTQTAGAPRPGTRSAQEIRRRPHHRTAACPPHRG
ncbi:AAA family ATPase [Frankia sp. R82]|uniref:AAA family ATPase n=1 Tax=Frankia sp. R82 TaxID=2950553 RepID=UPI0035ABE762